MKKNLLSALLILPFTLFSQEEITSNQEPNWVTMMQDPKSNFYEVQKAFNMYWQGKEIEKGKGYKQFRRWEEFMKPRVYPSGNLTLPSTTYDNFLEWEKKEESAQAFEKAGVFGTWSFVGPLGKPTNGGAGRVNFVRFNPINAAEMYLGTPDGGLWKSTNSGSSWTTNTDQLATIGCSDLCISPTNTQTMYLATGDGEAGDRVSLGILKSINGGVTWSNTGVTWTAAQGYLIRKMIMHPTNPLIMIAVTNGGVLKTTDGWATFTVPQAGSFYDAEFKPADPSVVYISGTTVYRSINTGTTFVQVTTGVPSSAGVSRIALAVTANSPATVYILVGRNSDEGLLGVYKSTTSGTSFSIVKGSGTPNLLGYNQNGGDLGGQAFYDLAFNVSPTNANEVYVGGVNIWKSINGGTSWAVASSWTGSGTNYVHSDIHELAFLPGSGSTIFVACDGGIFKTTTSGTSWTDLSSSLAIAQQYRIGQSATNGSIMVAGHQDNGTNKNASGTWTQIYGGDGMDCFIDRTNSNNIYASYVYGEYIRSTNGGATWFVATSGLPYGNPGIEWLSTWHQDPVTASTLYAAGRPTLYKTTNSASSWLATGTMGGSGNVIEFAIAPSNNQIIYALKNGTVFKSINGGGSWAAVATPSTQFPTYIAVSPTNANVAWATYSGYGASAKVFQTTNGGTSWVNLSSGLPNIPVNCVAVIPGTTTDAIMIGTDLGIFYRDNTTASWSNISSTLPKVAVRDIEFFGIGATLKTRVGTYGRGTWESGISGSFKNSEYSEETSAIEANDSKITIFPNPSNGEVNINCDEPILAISIINMNGKEVYYSLPGLQTQKHLLDLKTLGAGSYVMKFVLENRVETTTIVLKNE
jgi:Secretion system C-terminal sorting domain